jgi:hypothetical protein
MPALGILQQRNVPYVSYCQSFDCSKITIDFDFDTCNPLYAVMTLNGGTVSVSGSIDTAVFSDIDITDNLYKELTGTISVNVWSDQLTGINTLFTTELSPGDYIYCDGILNMVYSIESDTLLTLTSISSLDITNSTGYYVNFSYDITPATFGWTTTVMPEGAYTITVTFTFPVSYNGGQVIIDTQTINIYCEKYCCVYNRLADLADKCNECMTQDNVKDIADALLMWGLLEAHKNAAACGDTVSLNEIQKRLDRYCDYKPCTSC